jgi:hypothetical protein
MRRLFALALIALGTVAAVPAPPPPGTCGGWVSQTDGTSWRMCTDARDEQYCELKSGGSVTRIVCP